MAKRRIINTKFWSDNYISNLDPSEKLLFLYFLTNPYTNISGAYEISIKQIALDTGFDKEMVEKIIKRFKKDDKVHYMHGYIVVKNFIRHQENNPKVIIGVENEAKNLPNDIKNIVYDSLSYLNSNLNPNSNPVGEEDKPLTPAQEARRFFEGEFEPILHEFIEKTRGNETALRNEFAKFILYWTEKNKSGTKQKWELETTFEVRRRIANWLSRSKDFNLKSKANYVL